MFTNWRRRRRIYNIVLFLAVACLLALCFQFFLFGAISIYHDEHGSSGWFERGARPKFIEDAGGVDGLRHVPRVTWRDKDVQAQSVKTSFDCKDQNCSRLEADNTLNKYQFHAVAEQTVRLLANSSAVVSSGTTEGAIAKGKRIDPQLFSNVWQYLDHASLTVVKVNTTSVLGTYSRWQHFYQVDENGFFTCILSQVKIPFSHVNDDFCDCPDHSDEPGTSACPNGRVRLVIGAENAQTHAVEKALIIDDPPLSNDQSRSFWCFYCTFQSTIHSDMPKWLPSSRVNDGLCDCCDGSDEWANRTLPKQILHKDGAHRNGIYQAPCSDRCEELRTYEAKLAELRALGSALKEDYLKAGQGQSNPNNLYGMHAEFYKLHSLCVDIRSGKYSYSVCPFGMVKQTDAGHSSIVIGRSPEWLDRGPDVYRLSLNDGDSTNCPGLQPRKTVVLFECGVEDHVVNISENEVCQYLVRFSTPAAC